MALDEQPHDPSHGWSNGRLLRRHRMTAIEKLLLLRSYKHYLRPICPAVQAITSMVFRRTTRCMLAYDFFDAMLQSLPNLYHFNYEIWRTFIRINDRYILDRCKGNDSKIHDDIISILTAFCSYSFRRGSLKISPRVFENLYSF